MKSHIVPILIAAVFASNQAQSEQSSTSSTQQFLTDDVLQGKSMQELRLLRNEVFARKGYVFESEDLFRFFSSQSWYTPNPNLVLELSDEEAKYVARLKELEESKSVVAFEDAYSCIDQIYEVSSVYPITFEATQDYRFYQKIAPTEINLYSNETIRNISCEGIAYNLKCTGGVDYLLIPTAQCGEFEAYLAIINGSELDVRLIYGNERDDDGSNNFMSYEFILDKNFLEIVKRRIYGKEEVSSEVIVYQFTDSGLDEL